MQGLGHNKVHFPVGSASIMVFSSTYARLDHADMCCCRNRNLIGGLCANQLLTLQAVACDEDGGLSHRQLIGMTIEPSCHSVIEELFHFVVDGNFFGLGIGSDWGNAEDWACSG